MYLKNMFIMHREGTEKAGKIFGSPNLIFNELVN